MKTLVLGLGNSIRADDGVGLYVSRAVRETVSRDDVDIKEASVSGLDILDILSGYDRAIIIDAVRTSGGTAGQIHRLDPSAFQATRHSVNPHSADLATSLELGRRLGLPLPEDIVIFGVEVADTDTFSEECTAPVTSSIPVCASMVVKELTVPGRTRRRDHA